jgi:hypothetical protein
MMRILGLTLGTQLGHSGTSVRKLDLIPEVVIDLHSNHIGVDTFNALQPFMLKALKQRVGQRIQDAATKATRICSTFSLGLHCCPEHLLYPMTYSPHAIFKQFKATVFGVWRGYTALG